MIVYDDHYSRLIAMTDAVQSALQRLKSRPTVSVEDASLVLDLGRTAAYDAVRRGDIEVFRAGKSIKVLSAPLLRRLGIQA